MRLSKTALRNGLMHGCLGLCLTLLAACGGGGGATSVALEGGIGGTGISRGPVTAYGSIVVNGVHFNIHGATFYRYGQPASSKPNIGEVVLVRGAFGDNGHTGTADKVTYRPLVVGPVTQAPDAAAGTVGILGQTVHVDGRTVFDGFNKLQDLNNLSTDALVEVSGLFMANGDIQATLLRLRKSPTSAIYTCEAGWITSKRQHSPSTTKQSRRHSSKWAT